MDHAQQQGMSERWACRVVKQPRGTQRYRPTQREDEDRLTQAIVVLVGQYGRYGYRRITALLVHAGWKVGKDRVERIWRREGAEGSQEAEATRPSVAQRWIMRATATGAPQPRVELRLRERAHA